MPVWILKLLKYVPGIGALIERITGGSAKADEIRAETEQVDLRGFYRTGRISAAHLWKYAKVLIAFIVVLAFCACPFVPGAGESAVSMLDAFISAIVKLFTVDM